MLDYSARCLHRQPDNRTHTVKLGAEQVLPETCLYLNSIDSIIFDLTRIYLTGIPETLLKISGMSDLTSMVLDMYSGSG